MPKAKQHVHFALTFRDYLKVNNLDQYLFGCVCPDVPWLSFNDEEMSELRRVLHYAYTSSNGLFYIANWRRFIKEYKTVVKDSDLLKGYFTHLVLDGAYNSYWAAVSDADGDMARFNGDRLTREELIKLKWDDAGSFADMLFVNQPLSYSEVVPASQELWTIMNGISADSFISEEAVTEVNSLFKVVHNTPGTLSISTNISLSCRAASNLAAAWELYVMGF